MTRICTFSIALAAALIASPLAAQQRVQDFTLPPNPTPTPTVEGPADDAGPVPIAPRVIPTDSPTPSPTPRPSPIPSPTGNAAVPTGQESPASRSPTTTPSPTSATPAARSTPSPAPAQAAPDPATTQPAQQPAGPAESPSALDGLPQFTPEPIAPATPDIADAASAEKGSLSLPQWWPWAAGLLLALLLGILGGWAMARRRANRPAPQIEPPIVDQGGIGPGASPAAEKARIVATLEVERLTRSMMALTLNFRVTIANRSDRAVRDLAVSADMVSARRNLPVEQQVATIAAQLPPIATVERVGPHQSAVVSGELRLPISEIELFQQGQVPLCVPLARLRVDSPQVEPFLRTFLIGLGTGSVGARVHPLPLNGPPSGYEGAMAKALD